MRKQLLALILLVMSCGFTADVATAAAAKYPTKPVNLIVPNSSGRGSDTAARALAGIARKHLGQSLIVINKPGGSGSNAHTEIARAKSDGYTPIITTNGPTCNVPITFVDARAKTSYLTL